MLRKKTGAELAADKAALRSLWTIYKALFSFPCLVALVVVSTVIGYGLGYFDGWRYGAAKAPVSAGNAKTGF